LSPPQSNDADSRVFVLSKCKGLILLMEVGFDNSAHSGAWRADRAHEKTSASIYNQGADYV
jgi:hypothetical protein